MSLGGPWLAALALACLPFATPAAATRPEPAAVQGIGVDERLDAQLPLELELRDSSGARVRLGRYFDGAPVVLVLGYYHCRMLCGRVLDGTTRALAELEGRPEIPRFRMLSVSIDPRDDPESARRRRARVLEALGWSESRWPFLVGDEAQVGRLADRVGFEYRYDPDTHQYAHPAVLQVLSPQGRVAAYLYGVKFDPEALASALAAAEQGRTRNAVDRALMRCFRYVPALRRYADELGLFFRAGAVAVVLVSGAAVGWLGWRARARVAKR